MSEELFSNIVTWAIIIAVFGGFVWDVFLGVLQTIIEGLRDLAYIIRGGPPRKKKKKQPRGPLVDIKITKTVAQDPVKEIAPEKESAPEMLLKAREGLSKEEQAWLDLQSKIAGFDQAPPHMDEVAWDKKKRGLEK